MNTLDDSNMYLDLLLAFCFKTADLRQYLVQIEVLIDRFVRISIDNCCCCWTETLHYFFSRASIVPIPLDLLGKEIGIHRRFHPPITGYNYVSILNRDVRYRRFSMLPVITANQILMLPTGNYRYHGGSVCSSYPSPGVPCVAVTPPRGFRV